LTRRRRRNLPAHKAVEITMQNATQLLPKKTAGREEKTEIQTLSCKTAAKKETHPPFPPTTHRPE
jgi:hypothetical protein